MDIWLYIFLPLHLLRSFNMLFLKNIWNLVYNTNFVIVVVVVSLGFIKNTFRIITTKQHKNKVWNANEIEISSAMFALILSKIY
jgi:hypothetical protein